jgi:6-phosphogluconolactonase/glucosamine-6-phosphate isomerase/deaminase
MTGEEKASIVATIFGPDRDPHRWPAQLALREGATWILDEAAASGLPDR